MYLSGGLVAGVLAQAVLGGIVVYTKLNPYLVMVHFFATMVLLVDAVVLVHRDRLDYGPGSARLLVPRPLLRLHYGVLVVLAFVIAAGTATTGAGPHAGDASGQQVAKRIPIALRDMAELHSSLALLLVGLTIGLVVGLHMGDVPERVRRAGRVLLVVMVAQAAVGYTQYFTHLPAASGRSPPAWGHRPRHRGGAVLSGLHLPSGRGRGGYPAHSGVGSEAQPAAAGIRNCGAR